MTRRKETQTTRSEVQAAQADLEKIVTEADEIHRAIPNLSHPDAPHGADDQANLEVTTW